MIRAFGTLGTHERVLSHFGFWHSWDSQVLSNLSGTRGTREYSVFSDGGTRWTREYSVISAVGTRETREYSVASAFCTRGTEHSLITGTRESMTEFPITGTGTLTTFGTLTYSQHS